MNSGHFDGSGAQHATMYEAEQANVAMGRNKDGSFGSSRGDFVSSFFSMGPMGWMVMFVVAGFIVSPQLAVAGIIAVAGGVFIRCMLSKKLKIMPADFIYKNLIVKMVHAGVDYRENKFLGATLLYKGVQLAEAAFFGLIVFIFALGIIMAIFPEDGGARERAAEHAAIMQGADVREVSVMSEGHNLKLAAVVFADEFTILQIRQTKEKGAYPLLFTGQGEKEQRTGPSGKLSVSFKVVTASGKEHEQIPFTGFSSYYDQKLGDYAGFDIKFPKEFRETEFDLIETTWRGSDLELGNPLIIRGVKVPAGKN